MRKSLMLLTSSLVFICSVLTPALADDAFNGKQGDVTRSSLGLFGGRTEDLQIASNGNLYVGMHSANGIFCSTNGAESWIAPAAGNDLAAVESLVVGETPDTVYIVGGIQLYKTTDACQTWTELAKDAEAGDFGHCIAYGQGILLVPMRQNNGNPARLARSQDQGATFSVVQVGSDLSDILSIASAPSGGVFYMIAVESDGTRQLYKSEDFGETWTATGKTGNYSEVAVNPADAQEVILAGNALAERSTNGGGAWGDFTPNHMRQSTISFSGGRIYVSWQWTDDDGATWHETAPEGSQYDTEIRGYIMQHPTEAATMFAASVRGVAKTTDGGLIWHDQVEGIYGVLVSDMYQAADKNIVYLAATAGIAKSTNFTDKDNLSWTYPIKPDADGSTAYAVIALSSDSNKVVAGLEGARIYYSENGGDSWNEAVVPAETLGSVTDFVEGPDGKLYAGWGSRDDQGEGNVLVSEDEGHNWSTLTPVSFSAAVNVLMFNGSELLAGVGWENNADAARRGIYKYSEGAWSQLGGGIEGQVVNDLALAGTTLFAAAGETNQGGLYRSKDNGETWEKLTLGGDDGHLWLCSLAVDPADTNVVYAAHGRPAGNATIYQTKDLGDSWSIYYEGLRNEVPSVMMVDALTTGFTTGIFEFNEEAAAPTPTPTPEGPTPLPSATPAGMAYELKAKLNKRIAQFQCTLLGDEAPLAGRTVLMQKAPGKQPFNAGKSKTTNAKGQVKLRKLKAGTRYRCAYQPPEGEAIYSPIRKLRYGG